MRVNLSNPALTVLIVVLLGGMVAFHLQMKEKLDTSQVADMAKMVRDTRSWLGKPAPNFTATLTDGTRFELADHVGKQVVILNFFASWCQPCREELPVLIEFYAGAAKAGNVALIGVDSEDRATMLRFAAQRRINFPLVNDEDKALERAFGVSSFPTTVLIGVDGKVKVYQIGGISNTEVAFSEALDESAALVREGKAITREEFVRVAAAQPTPTPDASEGPALAGRARAIAEKMTCMCGCDEPLLKCKCGTAKKMRTKLAGTSLAGTSDEDVIRAINKEFCPKGN